MRALLFTILGVSLLGGCVSVNRQPLPSNHAVAQVYPLAAAGDGAAAMQLADYYRGQGAAGLGKDETETQRLWLQQAESGNRLAMMNLATAARSTDWASAIYWYRRAAEAGASYAPTALALIHADPKAVQVVDYQTALMWAYVADYKNGVAEYIRKQAPESVAEARHRADDWLAKYRNKDKK